MPRETMDAEDLLRQLLNLVEAVGVSAFSAKEKGGEVTAVLLDVQVDGVRFLLKRYDEPTGLSEGTLSPREQEVVRLAAKGLSNKAIAAVLGISIWTVSTHLRRIFSKLDVSSRTEMIMKAMQQGLLPVFHLPEPMPELLADVRA
jgi:DNA-binding NarL/FixJ family response regulator